MALGKIISIKNVGRFLNSVASGDVAFKRYNLVFAENGRGKTTLCAILRSLQSGEPAYIAGRTTLGSPDPPEVRLLLSGGPANFTSGAWNTTLPEIAVFDGTYVTENVYSGEVVDTEQRRNLYRVIIGDRGVGLARRIEDLDAQIRTKNTEIRVARAAVQHHVPQRILLDTFIGLAEDREIDERIAAKQRQLEAVRQADGIQQRAALATMALPEIPSDFTAVLAKTIEGVAVDAEQRIREHIATHEMGERGEPWLSEGLPSIRGETCPFCGQDIGAVALIGTYKAFFSDAYHALRDEIVALAADIETAFNDRGIGEIEHTVEQNVSGVEFWQRYCALDPPRIDDAAGISGAATALRDAATALLESKSASPLEPLQPDEIFAQAFVIYETARQTIATYNTAVEAVNAGIAAKKEETGTAEIGMVETELIHLRAQKTRHTPQVRQACEIYRGREVEKMDLENQKTETREQLDRHTEQVIATYGQSINRYLDRFNAGFRITTPTHSYRGGTASSSYQVLINEIPVDLGDASTPIDRPSFKNTVSSGDRSTLALSIFFAQLELDPNRAEKIVVLDDPFTSQDAFRRSQTAQQIKKSGEGCS